MNTQITEDYVSFETAKLLKEKGFDEKCKYVWKLDKANDPQDTDGISKVCAEQLIDGSFIDNLGINKVVEDEDWFEDYHKAYLCPTLQMAMKWLREVHNLHCAVDYDFVLGWYCQITSLKETVEYDYEEMKHYHLDKNNGFSSPEEACEAAIKYCLTNLI